MRGSASPRWMTSCPRCQPKSPRSSPSPSTSPVKRLSIPKLTLTTSTHILSRTFLSPNPIPCMVVLMIQNFTIKAITARGLRSSTLSPLAPSLDTTQTLGLSLFRISLSLATSGQKITVSRSMRRSPLQELLVLHQVLLQEDSVQCTEDCTSVPSAMYRYITHDYTRIHQFTIVSHSMTSSKLIAFKF